jgi:hypothetical protein
MNANTSKKMRTGAIVIGILATLFPLGCSEAASGTSCVRVSTANGQVVQSCS